jgi:hypothetical protein
MWWLATALAAELSGSVVTADGEPVVGATVTAYDARFNYASATTRNEGQWSIAGLPSGTYRVRVQPADSDPAADAWLGDTWSVCGSERVALGEGTAASGLVVTLAEGGRVDGRVLDSTGAPIEGARVSVYGDDDRTSLIAREASTDGEGGFTVVGLDASASGSPFRLLVEAGGWPNQFLGGSYTESESRGLTVALGGDADAGTLELLDGIEVSGVVEGADGPIADANVTVYSSQQVVVASTDEYGRYVAGGLPPGEVFAWVKASGFATTYYPHADRPGASLLVPDEGGAAAIDFELPADNPLTLTLSGDGEVGEVSVIVYNDAYTVGRGDGADEDGRVTLPGFWPGEYLVYVFGDDAGFVSGFVGDDGGEPTRYPVDGPTTHAIELSPAARIEGRVVGDNGAPVYGASVFASEVGGLERVWSDTADRDGNYAIEGVAPGAVRVDASYYYYCPDDPGWAQTWYLGARAVEGATLVQAVAGEVVEAVDIAMPADDDHDGMGDEWERENGLDPTRNDAGEDPDGDGFTNIEEWVLDTDPNGSVLAEECGGCGGGGPVSGAALAVGLAVLQRRRNHPART